MARGALNITGGNRYPCGYWLTAPDGSSIPADCPAWFREQAGRDWLEWVGLQREAWYASLDSGAPPEWNARGARSPLAARPGGAWSGAAHVVQGLVSDELAEWWTDCAPRMNKSEYVAHRWAETLREREMVEWNGIARLAAELNDPISETAAMPVGTLGRYCGIAWERGIDGWEPLTRDDGGVAVPMPADEYKPAGGGIAAAIASLAASGAFTPTMLDLIADTYRDGATGRKGRVIAPAGDWAAAVARGAGAVADGSKRAVAVAAAADCLTAAAGAALVNMEAMEVVF